MDPQQELFTALRQKIVGVYGEDSVYDSFLPPEGTPYPFIYIEDSILADDYGNKSVVGGTVTQTVSVWHDNSRKRGTLSAMLAAVKDLCRKLEETEHFHWYIQGIDQRILPDNTTTQPLMHGVLDVTYRFF